MDPDDQDGPQSLKKLSLLSNSGAAKFATDSVDGQCMDELAREMTTLKPGYPRRAQIAQEIMRLSDLLKNRSQIC